MTDEQVTYYESGWNPWLCATCEQKSQSNIITNIAGRAMYFSQSTTAVMTRVTSVQSITLKGELNPKNGVNDNFQQNIACNHLCSYPKQQHHVKV